MKRKAHFQRTLAAQTGFEKYVGVDLGMAAAPDETTILRFRHLLEEHDLGGAMLDEVNRHLADRGIRITTGAIVDATIIHAPSSTKNSPRRCTRSGRARCGAMPVIKVRQRRSAKPLRRPRT